MQARSRSFLILLLVIGVAGPACEKLAAPDGAEEDPGEPEEESFEPLDPAQAAQTVHDIENTVDDVFPTTDVEPEERDLLQEIQDVAAELETLPGVAAVKLDNEHLSATAILPSGIPVMVTNNRVSVESSLTAGPRDTAPSVPLSSRGGPDGSSPGDATVPSPGKLGAADGRRPAPPGETPAQAAVPAAELPESRKAVVVATGAGQHQASAVEGYLEAAGYQISDLTGSLEDMRRYKDLGVLYLDAHGGTYTSAENCASLKEFNNTNCEENEYALVTSTVAELSESWIDAHRQDLLSGDLIFTKADTGKVQIGISDSFIAKHWDFEGGLAFIHSCFFGADRASAHRQAILQSADVVISFDNFTATSFAQSSIFGTFRLLLGTYPYTRPWDLKRTRTTLEARGDDRFILPDRRFGIVPTDYVSMTFDGIDNLALVPALQRIEVVDNAPGRGGKLILDGQFGSKPGQVFLRGEEIDIESWKPGEIVAYAPLSRSGRTRVDVLNGEVSSNGVDLTEWVGRVVARLYHRDPNISAEAEMSLQVHFRADVHRRVKDPTDGFGEYPEVVRTYISPETRGDVFVAGKTGPLDHSATWTSGSEFTWILNRTQVDEGGPDVGRQQEDRPNESFFGGIVYLYPRQNEAELCTRMYGTWTEEWYIPETGDQGQRGISIAFMEHMAVTGAVEESSSGLYCITLSMPNLDTMELEQKNVSAGPFPEDMVWDGYDAWSSWGGFITHHPPR